MAPVRESLAVSGSSGQIPAGATVGGRFRIDGLLSQDGVSQTYRATDVTHRSAASVRVIPMRVLGASAAQLETDVENASALVHKNLVEVLTVGREHDFFFLATELLDGQTLREFIDGKKSEGRTVSFRGACNLVTHIANGLERAASTMPHGGLNPATVWVNKAGRVKVADMGLAVLGHGRRRRRLGEARRRKLGSRRLLFTPDARDGEQEEDGVGPLGGSHREPRHVVVEWWARALLAGDCARGLR